MDDGTQGAKQNSQGIAGPSSAPLEQLAEDVQKPKADSLQLQDPRQHQQSQQPHQHPNQHRRGGGGGLTSTLLRRRLQYVPARAPVIIRLPNGRFKTVELHPGAVVSLGKYGTFRADDLIGLPFGLTFEVGAAADAANAEGHGEMADQDAARSVAAAETDTRTRGQRDARQRKPKAGKKSSPVCGTLRVVMSTSVQELEDNLATNELIDQDTEEPAQKMTFLDIKALKEAGIEGKDIVQRQVESNTSYLQRTSWSQQKFVLRKEAKHMRLFTPVAPTLVNVARYVAERYERETNDKIRGLRADSLSSILSQAGVAPGKRFIVVDGVGGLLAGAILERMGGEGRLLALNDADSPPAFDLLGLFNLPGTTIDHVLRSMHWACTERDWHSVVAPDDDDEGHVTPTGKRANDRDRQRFKKRRAAHNELERTRNELFEGGWDGLIVATSYEPCSIVERLLPFLAGSSNVVVHSPYLQPLVESHAHLRTLHSLINVSVTEPWLRRYQVLPGRMHPEMMTSSSAGFVLHAIRVLTDDETTDMMATRDSQKSVTTA